MGQDYWYYSESMNACFWNKLDQLGHIYSDCLKSTPFESRWVCRNPWSCCFSQTQYQVLSEWLEMHNHTDAKAQTKWAAFISLSHIAHHWIILETDPKKRLQEAIEWTFTPQRCDFHVAMLGRLHSDVTAFHSEMKNEALHLLIMFKITMFCHLPHEMIWEV